MIHLQLQMTSTKYTHDNLDAVFDSAQANYKQLQGLPGGKKIADNLRNHFICRKLFREKSFVSLPTNNF